MFTPLRPCSEGAPVGDKEEVRVESGENGKNSAQRGIGKRKGFCTEI